MISAAILVVLFGSSLAFLGNMTYFLKNNDTRSAFAVNSSMAFAKLETELRKIGYTVVGGTSYPYIVGGGAEFRFVRLADPPTNYDGSADLIWDPTEYSVKIVNGQFGIWQGAQQKLLLCTNAQSVSFSLSGRKVTIDLTLQVTDARGNPVTSTCRRIIVFRN